MNLKMRLEKLEAAIIPKVAAIRRALFRVHGQSKAFDDQGREYPSIDEARGANEEADEYQVVNREQMETIKKFHKMADEL